jgi:hypothetical protein
MPITPRRMNVFQRFDGFDESISHVFWYGQVRLHNISVVDRNHPILLKNSGLVSQFLDAPINHLLRYIDIRCMQGFLPPLIRNLIVKNLSAVSVSRGMAKVPRFGSDVLFYASQVYQ